MISMQLFLIAFVTILNVVSVYALSPNGNKARATPWERQVAGRTLAAASRKSSITVRSNIFEIKNNAELTYAERESVYLSWTG